MKQQNRHEGIGAGSSTVRSRYTTHAHTHEHTSRSVDRGVQCGSQCGAGLLIDAGLHLVAARDYSAQERDRVIATTSTTAMTTTTTT